MREMQPHLAYLINPSVLRSRQFSLIPYVPLKIFFSQIRMNYKLNFRDGSRHAVLCLAPFCLPSLIMPPWQITRSKHGTKSLMFLVIQVLSRLPGNGRLNTAQLWDKLLSSRGVASSIPRLLTGLGCILSADSSSSPFVCSSLRDSCT